MIVFILIYWHVLFQGIWTKVPNIWKFLKINNNNNNVQFILSPINWLVYSEPH